MICSPFLGCFSDHSGQGFILPMAVGAAFSDFDWLCLPTSF